MEISNKQFSTLVTLIKGVDKKVGSIDTRLGSVETKLKSVDTRVGLVETKLGSVETKLGSVEKKVNSLESKVGSIDEKVGSLDKKVGSLQTKFGSLEKKVVALDKKVDLVKRDLSEQLTHTKDLLLQEDKASEKRMMAKIDSAKDEAVTAVADQIDGVLPQLNEHSDAVASHEKRIILLEEKALA